MAYQIFSDMSCLFPYSLYFYHHIEKHDMIMKTQFCSFLLCWIIFCEFLPAQSVCGYRSLDVTNPIEFLGNKILYAYSGGYPFSISGDIRSVPS